MKENSSIFVICDAFTYFVVTKPTTLNDAEIAADVSIKKWIIFSGQPKSLVTDKGTEVFQNYYCKKCNFLALYIIQDIPTLLGQTDSLKA